MTGAEQAMADEDHIPRDQRLAVDADLVRKLVAEQFPHWAGLPIRPVAVNGWDNSTFHLGDSMKVRLPMAAGYVSQTAKEVHWLPLLAPQLPQPIPAPIAIGRPGHGYPFQWSVYGWLAGETALRERIGDLVGFADGLADFLLALERIDPLDAPLAGRHNFYRGGQLAVYDAETRASVAALGERVDGAAALALWNAALATTWPRPPVWVHGDIAWGNLLVRDGRLAAVIDFGSAAVGDPACDLVISWTLFEGASRERFRVRMAMDSGTWARGRAWGLWKALLVMRGHAEAGNAAGAEEESRLIETILEDHRRFG